jgi:hypothetical protein
MGYMIADALVAHVKRKRRGCVIAMMEVRCVAERKSLVVLLLVVAARYD